MTMRWNPFKDEDPDLTDAIDEAARRQQVYRLGQEIEAYAEKLTAKTRELREVLEHGADT